MHFGAKLGYTPVVKPFLRDFKGREVSMPTKNTKIITLRVPDRVDFGDVNLHKFITHLYDMVTCGAIEIVDNELVMSGEEDEDGVWVREMAHDLNIDKEVFKKKVEQGMR